MSILSSNRPQDMAQEKVISQFLDTYLYKKRTPRYAFIQDKELQVQGVDVVVENGETPICHDIKAQAAPQYINYPRPTFALELIYGAQDSPSVGWFLNLSLLTDYYVFVWIFEAVTDDSGYIIHPEDIKRVEVSFINSTTLHNYVMKTHALEELYVLADYMRVHSVRSFSLTDDMYLVYTATLAEKPVNLVVKKRVLDKLATERYMVTQDELLRLDD